MKKYKVIQSNSTIPRIPKSFVFDQHVSEREINLNYIDPYSIENSKQEVKQAALAFSKYRKQQKSKNLYIKKQQFEQWSFFKSKLEKVQQQLLDIKKSQNSIKICSTCYSQRRKMEDQKQMKKQLEKLISRITNEKFNNHSYEQTSRNLTQTLSQMCNKKQETKTKTKSNSFNNELNFQDIQKLSQNKNLAKYFNSTSKLILQKKIGLVRLNNLLKQDNHEQPFLFNPLSKSISKMHQFNTNQFKIKTSNLINEMKLNTNFNQSELVQIFKEEKNQDYFCSQKQIMQSYNKNNRYVDKSKYQNKTNGLKLSNFAYLQQKNSEIYFPQKQGQKLYYDYTNNPYNPLHKHLKVQKQESKSSQFQIQQYQQIMQNPIKVEKFQFENIKIYNETMK